MMALMENAAMLAVADELPEGCTTVGGHIESSHLKPSKIDDKDFICHVDFTQMHVIKHFFCAKFPNFFIAGMSEQPYADDNAAFKRQPFLNFHILLLETSTSAESDNFVVLYHLTKF